MQIKVKVLVVLISKCISSVSTHTKINKIKLTRLGEKKEKFKKKKLTHDPSL